jgi:hypothetical protein
MFTAVPGTGEYIHAAEAGPWEFLSTALFQEDECFGPQRKGLSFAKSF